MCAAELPGHSQAVLLPLAGNYAVFEKTAAERLRNLRSKIESQEAHRKHVQVMSASEAARPGAGCQQYL
jgi:ATPase subunit of ABC transporter with duplicated ATPase domains